MSAITVEVSKIPRRIIPVTILLTLCFGLIFQGTAGNPIVTGEQQQFQYGQTSCSIPANSNTCFSIVTFSPAFPAGSSINEMCLLNVTSNFQNTLPISDSTLVTAPTIWTGGMPAAKTELFGSTAYRVQAAADKTLTLSTIGLGVNLVTASTSATAIIDLEYATNLAGAGPWTSIGINLNVNSITFGRTKLVTVSVPTAILGLGVLFRVVGQNGAGATDLVSFSQLFITFEWIQSNYPVIQTIPLDNTSFACNINTPNQPTTELVVFDWSATICKNGQLSC